MSLTLTGPFLAITLQYRSKRRGFHFYTQGQVYDMDNCFYYPNYLIIIDQRDCQTAVQPATEDEAEETGGGL